MRIRPAMWLFAIVLASCTPVRRPATPSVHECILGAALEAVTYGELEAARAGDLLLARTGDGAVRVVRSSLGLRSAPTDDRAI